VRDFSIIMIRHKLPFLYLLLELLNEIYGHIFFRDFKRSLSQHVWKGIHPNERVDILTAKDIPMLLSLFRSTPDESTNLFRPHALTEKRFQQLMRAPNYLAVGYCVAGELVGYAFLRLYFPKKAFAGYFVKYAHRRKGIGKFLFGVIKNISRETSFALYTYVKEENYASIRVSSDFIVEQRMPGAYLLLRHGNKVK